MLSVPPTKLLFIPYQSEEKKLTLSYTANSRNNGHTGHTLIQRNIQFWIFYGEIQRKVIVCIRRILPIVRHVGTSNSSEIEAKNMTAVIAITPNKIEYPSYYMSHRNNTFHIAISSLQILSLNTCMKNQMKILSKRLFRYWKIFVNFAC